VKSIRSRLLIWLLLGIACFWLLGATGSLYFYRSGLLADLETELITLSRQVRMNQMQGSRLTGDDTARPHHGPGSAYAGGNSIPEDVYWQVWWTGESEDPARSSNLVGDLPRMYPKHGDSSMGIVTFENGQRTMVVGGLYGMGEHASEISVAKDLQSVNQALLGAFTLALGIGGSFAAIATLWVFYALRSGLAPLKAIADQVASVEPDSLKERFEFENAPLELKPVVARLNELMERMESGFDRERRFSSDLAHEMRTPIAELRMQIESAIKWPEEGGKPAWETALESVDRIEGIVQTMLRLARIEQRGDEEPPSEASLDLSSLVEELWEENRSQAEESGIRLSTKIPPETNVAGDPALWRHLLGNLLSNVATYADPGSEAQAIAEPNEARNQPLIRIVNTASNLSEEDVDHLFERFWRGQGARDSSSRYGLGLSLANACAAALGLRLSARLRPETGSLEILIAPGD
jgi:signal transduction histidine kinase